MVPQSRKLAISGGENEKSPHPAEVMPAISMTPNHHFPDPASILTLYDSLRGHQSDQTSGMVVLGLITPGLFIMSAFFLLTGSLATKYIPLKIVIVN